MRASQGLINLFGAMRLGKALSKQIPYWRLAQRRAELHHCFCLGIADALRMIRRRKGVILNCSDSADGRVASDRTI
jgi:hypothetical protein